MPPRKQRYARAEEFVEVAQQLWDSWADDAAVANRDGEYADSTSLRPVHHSGEHFQVDGPLTVPRPPQGRPVLFQAGASGPGRNLAARYAEAIYAVDALLPTEQSLAQLSKFIHPDCSGWDLDAPVSQLPPLEGFLSPQGRYATIPDGRM